MNENHFYNPNKLMWQRVLFLIFTILLLGDTFSVYATTPAGSNGVPKPENLVIFLPWADGVAALANGNGYGEIGSDHTGNQHFAIDLNLQPNNSGMNVLSARQGDVIYADYWTGSGFGNTVIIRHDIGDDYYYYSQYAHLATLEVTGDRNVPPHINLGQILGREGETGGTSTGPHLHFSITRCNKTTNIWNGNYPSELINDTTTCRSVVPEPIIGRDVYEGIGLPTNWPGPLYGITPGNDFVPGSPSSARWGAGTNANYSTVSQGQAIYFNIIGLPLDTKEVRLTAWYNNWSNMDDSIDNQVWRIVERCYPGKTECLWFLGQSSMTFVWNPYNDSREMVVPWLPAGNLINLAYTEDTLNPVCISFDVFDQAGNVAYAPAGVQCSSEVSSIQLPNSQDINPNSTSDTARLVYISPIPSYPNDNILPTGSWISPNMGQSISASTVTLNVSASDNPGGSGVREVRWAALYGGKWYGIGTDYDSPYTLNWDWCAAGVPDNANEDVELGFEVWDNANNKWVYSENGNVNIHIKKNYTCGSGGANWSTSFYNNGLTHWYDINDTGGFMCNQSYPTGFLVRDYGDGSPCGGATDNWVGDYKATVNFSTGNYAFWVDHDDYLKLFIDNQEEYSVNGVHEEWYCPKGVNKTLSGNHQVRVILAELGGQARVDVKWSKDNNVCNPPGAFGKSSPSNPSFGQPTSPTLSWGAASGATSYSYCIDTTNDNSCDNPNWYNVNSATSVAISGLNPDTTYYWQVKAYSQGGIGTDANNGAWWSFTTQTNAPGIFDKVSPANSSSSQPTSVILNWAASAGTSWYQYCYDTTNNNMCDNDIWYSAGTDTSASIFDLAGNTTYYWHVRASNAGGITYANDNTWWSFTTQLPPSPPSDIGVTKGDYEDEVFVVWLPSLESTRYELWRNTIDSNDLAIRIAGNVIPDHPSIVRYNDFSAIAGTIYYYWAKACNSAGCSDFSRSDHGYRSTGIMPVNILTNGDFEEGITSPSWWSTDAWTLPYSTFSWDADFVHSGSKSVKISTLPNANDARWIQTIQVQPNSGYRLSGWIKTNNVSNANGGVGANLSLLNGTLTYSTPIFGDNDWRNVSLYFNTGSNTELTIAARIGMYSGITTGTAWFDDLKLELLSSPTCYSLTKTAAPSGGGNITANPFPNCNNGTQYVHGTVVSLTAAPNTGFNFSNWSGSVSDSNNPTYVTMTAIKSVTANFIANIPGAFNKLYPANGTTGISINPTLSWEPSTNATFYEYCIATSAATCTVWNNVGNQTYAVPTTLIKGTTYYWNVRARNNTGSKNANGGITSFTTGNVPATFGKSSPANGSLNRPANTSLMWGSSAGAISYEYCLDTTNDNACQNNNWIAATSPVDLSGMLLPNTTYYWQVRALNSFGPRGANGGVWWNFQTVALPSAFNKSVPVNLAINIPLTPTLSWAASTNVTKYEYCYDTTNDGLCDSENWINNGAATSIKLGIPLLEATTYYWQVRAVNSFGNKSSNNGSWYSFKTGTTPSAFTKVGPPDGATFQPLSLILSWNPSAGATSYKYCLSTTPTCSTWSTALTTTNVSISGLSYDTTYYWHVRASNTIGTTYSDGDAWHSFTTGHLPGLFTKNQPANLATGVLTNPALSWFGSADATSYEYCLSTISNSCTNWASVGNQTYVNLNGLIPSTTYYWNVRARNIVGIKNAADPQRSFTIGAVPAAFNKTAPANLAQNQHGTVTLKWANTSGETGYEYCVDSVNNTTCDSANGWVTVGADITGVTVSGLSANTTYYWQIRGVNNFGRRNADGGVWWSFKTRTLPGAFNKSAPANLSLNVSLTPTLSWAASTNFTRYEYCIDTTNDNQCENSNWINNNTNVSVAIASPLLQSTNYYWQVRAVNTVGVSEANANVWWSFTTEGPPVVFNKVSPADTSIDQPVNITLSWNPSSNADRYEYCYDTSNDNLCDTPWINNGSTTTTVVPNLNPSTTYYWHVIAYNSLGSQESDSDSWWSFSTGILPGSFNKTGPLNDAVDAELTPTISWDPSTGATGYLFCVDAVNNDMCDAGWLPTSNTRIQTALLLPNTAYYWQVKASNSIGETLADNGLWWHFTTKVMPIEQLSIQSFGGNDGWILESTETSGQGGTLNSIFTQLYIGDDAANKQYRSILSFDTSILLDNAVVTKVTLKFKHIGFAGTSPFSTHGNLLVDLRKGPFSNNAILQLNDFKAAASKNGVLSFTSTLLNNWYSQSFLPENFQYISLDNVTQFRLRFDKDDNNDRGADFLKIYSGNAGAANRPQLVIEYYVP